jgi:protein-disulfide isomerase
MTNMETSAWRPFVILNRRQTLIGLSALTASTFLLSACSEGDQASAGDRTVPEGEEKAFDLKELMEGSKATDHALGEPDAPVVMIEYASLTCGFCRNFHENTFPQIKEQYIDTGKVYFISRDFPLDPRALGAAMLANCAGKEQYFNMIDVLFERQRVWSAAPDPLPVLQNIVAQAGFTEETFNACLTNQELQAAIQSEAERARDAFEVSSTPTFFINGRKFSGDRPFEEFKSIIEPLAS